MAAIQFLVGNQTNRYKSMNFTFLLILQEKLSAIMKGRRGVGRPAWPGQRGARPPGHGSLRCSGRQVRGARSASTSWPGELAAQQPPAQ